MLFLSGKDFNEKYKNVTLVKLTTETENHHNFQFKTGLNTSYITINPKDEYGPGGLYFCEFKDFPMWLQRYENGYEDNIFIRYVTIPDDAKIYIGNCLFKANKFILSERKLIEDLDEWNNKSFRENAFKLNEKSLTYVKNPPPGICLEAVKQKGFALRYVNKQTPEICLAAVKQDGHALEFVKEQTDEICLAAVKRSGHILWRVKNKKYNICLSAVKRCGESIGSVKKMSYKLCLEAVKQSGWALEKIAEKKFIKGTDFTKKQIEEICLAAINTDVEALQYVEKHKFTGTGLTAAQKEKIRLAAINKDPKAFRYVHNKTYDICLAVVKKDPEYIYGLHYEYKYKIANELGIQL
jgi:hypothetical protein